MHPACLARPLYCTATAAADDLIKPRRLCGCNGILNSVVPQNA